MGVEKRGPVFFQDVEEKGIVKTGPFGVLSLKKAVEGMEIGQGVYFFYRENVQIPLSGGDDEGMIPFQVIDLGKDPASGPE